jgi:hypothetical protein
MAAADMEAIGATGRNSENEQTRRQEEPDKQRPKWTLLEPNPQSEEKRFKYARSLKVKFLAGSW